jgi:hypothetical protein
MVHVDRASSTPLEGVVAYVGVVTFAEGDDWVGVRLTGASVGLGNNDGSVQGVSYFKCPPSCGMFVRESALSKRSMTRTEELRVRREILASPKRASSSPGSVISIGAVAPASPSTPAARSTPRSTPRPRASPAILQSRRFEELRLRRKMETPRTGYMAPTAASSSPARSAHSMDPVTAPSTQEAPSKSEKIRTTPHFFSEHPSTPQSAAASQQVGASPAPQQTPRPFHNSPDKTLGMEVGTPGLSSPRRSTASPSPAASTVSSNHSGSPSTVRLDSNKSPVIRKTPDKSQSRLRVDTVTTRVSSPGGSKAALSKSPAASTVSGKSSGSPSTPSVRPRSDKSATTPQQTRETDTSKAALSVSAAASTVSGKSLGSPSTPAVRPKSEKSQKSRATPQVPPKFTRPSHTKKQSPSSRSPTARSRSTSNGSLGRVSQDKIVNDLEKELHHFREKFQEGEAESDSLRRKLAKAEDRAEEQKTKLHRALQDVKYYKAELDREKQFQEGTTYLNWRLPR